MTNPLLGACAWLKCSQGTSKGWKYLKAASSWKTGCSWNEDTVLFYLVDSKNTRTMAMYNPYNYQLFSFVYKDLKAKSGRNQVIVEEYGLCSPWHWFRKKSYFNSGESVVCDLFLPPLAWMKIFDSCLQLEQRSQVLSYWLKNHLEGPVTKKWNSLVTQQQMKQQKLKLDYKKWQLYWSAVNNWHWHWLACEQEELQDRLGAVQWQPLEV